MHHRMNWGDFPHTRLGHGGMEVDVPLIPAPVAMMTMLFGVAIGVMIGYKKAQMHGGAGMMGGAGHPMMGGTGHPMMGGMGHGAMGAGMAGRGFEGDWMTRKKAMMRAMAAHHHHQYGSGPCWCGAGAESAEAPESAEKEESGHA